MEQISETRNLLSMWGAHDTGTICLDTPVEMRNYFAMPGLIKQPSMPKAYHREPGKMPLIQFSPGHIRQLSIKALNIDYKTLMNRCRQSCMVDNRCVVVWLCYKYAYQTGMGKIARLINRDRTTAMHMVERANNCIETREWDFIEKLQLVEMRLLTV